jgi:hypothetical protein
MSDTDNDRSLTIDGFCQLESISRASFFSLQRRGLAPETYCVPQTRIVRISAKARHEWRERMAELSKQEAGRLEEQRRRDQAIRAGKLAVESDRHVSKRRGIGK